MINPFKNFLGSYSKDDINVFFGRDKEIDDLYKMVFESNILMVYGASGTGKTSLIQCGLASKFEPHDWLDLYIRRGNNLNASFDKIIAGAGKNAGGMDLQTSFNAIYRNSFRPLYLIFDQFEELFILGDKKEQEIFIKTVKGILNVEQPVKMIFSIREEYLGHLYDFENEVPGLMRKKLRVEAMGIEKVREVITKAAGIPGTIISLKAGEEKAIVNAIFSKLRASDTSDTIELPYLQVFLDKLCNTIRDKTKNDCVEFDLETIEGMRGIGDILQDFLEDQVKAISETLVIDDKPVIAEEIWNILSPFATAKGTKEPISMQNLVGRLVGRFPEMSEKRITVIVNALLSGRSRILVYKKEADAYELVHDALAAKIAAKRSNEDREKLEVEALIEDQVTRKEAEFFSEKLLIRIDAVFKNLKLTEEEIKLVSDSRAAIKAQKEKQRNRVRLTFAVMAGVMLLLSGLAIWAIGNRNKADRLAKEADRQTKIAKAATSLVLSGIVNIYLYVKPDYAKAFIFSRYTYQRDTGNVDAQAGIYTTFFQDRRKPAFWFSQHTLRHSGSVNLITFSPDGKRVLTASDDKTAKIWDVASGKEIASLTGHTQPVWTAVFSPDGKRVVTASADSTAKIWDAASGKEIASLTGHTDQVLSAIFSPDGKRVVTASEDKTAKIWDAVSGKETASLTGHSKVVTSAVFSPDGKRVATASEDKTAKIWDAASGREIVSLTGHTQYVFSALFSPDGKRVVTASADETAKIWNAASGREIVSLTGHTQPVWSAVFSPDGNRVLTASADATAKIWDAASGKQIAAFTGHGQNVRSAVFSPDGNRVVTASYDKTAKIWDAASGKEIASLTGHADYLTSAAFSPDGNKVVTASYDKTAKIWDAASGKEITSLVWNVRSAVFSPDGNRVLTACDDSTAKIRDAASGNVITTLIGHTDQVSSAVFSPDGNRVVTASADSTAKIWDAASGKVIASLIGHTGGVFSAVFSPDGKRVVTASADKTAKIWDAASGKVIDSLMGHTQSVYSAAFSPDGKRVVTASADATAKIWDAASGKEIVSLKGHEHFVFSAVFSPDGKRVVTASGDRTAKIWDAASGNEIVSLTGHVGYVTSAVFSPNGKRVVTASADSTARIWDAASGKDIATLTGYGGRVFSAAFSPDGKRVITTSSDGTVKIWDIDIAGIIKEMENKIEDLTPEEKELYDIREKK